MIAGFDRLILHIELLGQKTVNKSCIIERKVGCPDGSAGCDNNILTWRLTIPVNSASPSEGAITRCEPELVVARDL